MKIMLICPICADKAFSGKMNQHETEQVVLPIRDYAMYVQVRQESVYPIKCRHGHSVVAVDQRVTFVQLLDSAALAFIDGYFRESLATLSSALESFYSFCIRVWMNKHTLEDKTKSEYWKQIYLAERTLGSYISLYLSEYGHLANMMSDKSISLRNKITHQGFFPNESDVIQFGDDVLQVITSALDQILVSDFNSYNSVITELIVEKTQSLPSGYRVITVAPQSVLQLPIIQGQLEHRNFEKAIEILKKTLIR